MKKLSMLLMCFICFVFLSTASASSILLTQFDYTGYLDMKTNLESFGHTVDIVDATVGGNVASALNNGSYDQLFLWDLTSTQYLNSTDYSAMGSFFSSHSSLVVDTRSYGYHFQGNNSSEVALLGNIADAFSSFGGGVWVGTDHNSDWTRNANPFLDEIGVELVTGSYSQAVNDSDPTSILLDGVTVTDLWAVGQSVGAAPLGIQDNGLDMRFHFGHSSETYGAIPYITASFGDYITDDEDPNDHETDIPVVPEPSTWVLLGSGLIGLVAYRKRR